MTDITELAQREKFEAWWEREYKHLESSKYTDAVPHIKYGLWMAYQAGGAELVEALENSESRLHEVAVACATAEQALEKAQRYIEELREWNAGLAQESFERQQLISELEPIRAAAEKLVRCKGRYHSEQNYRALAALFGVKTPDMPPLDSESRTVKLPKLKMLEDYLAEVAIEERKQILVGVKLEFHRALAAAGIKVEAE